MQSPTHIGSLQKRDPHHSPLKLRELLKLKPTEVAAPRFIRDSMKIEDIIGTKAKPLYRGVAREVL